MSVEVQNGPTETNLVTKNSTQAREVENIMSYRLPYSLAISDDLFAVYNAAWRKSALAPDARKQHRSVEHYLCSDTCGYYPCPTDSAFRYLLSFEQSLRQITRITTGKDHNHEAETEGHYRCQIASRTRMELDLWQSEPGREGVERPYPTMPTRH